MAAVKQSFLDAVIKARFQCRWRPGLWHHGQAAPASKSGSAWGEFFLLAVGTEQKV